MLQVRQLFVVRHFLVTVGTRMERGTALRTLRPIGVVARDHRVAELPIADLSVVVVVVLVVVVVVTDVVDVDVFVVVDVVVVVTVMVVVVLILVVAVVVVVCCRTRRCGRCS